MNTTTASTKNSRIWNYVPELPIRITPFFDWPPNAAEIWRWLSETWLRVAVYPFCAILAFVVYYTFQPAEESMREFAFGWAAQIWFRNLILMILVAGSLHLYFYILKKQGTELKYETRDQDRNSKTHDFGNQVLDNMFWTLVSGVAVWSMFEIVYFWASSNGYVPRLVYADNPIWFAAIFLLIPLWSSLHFYWIHRLLHWPPLFKLAHALHHRNVNVGPWSGISMHPIEHLLYFSSYLIHFVVASHPLHFLFHAYYQGLGPAVSHCGFESLKVGGKKRMELGVFYHQLHHKHYKCNYGTVEMPWDRWFGSYHDGTDEATMRIRKRKW